MQEGSKSLWSSKLFTPVVIVFILCAVGGMAIRSIKNNYICAEDQCSFIKNYQTACMIERQLYCCGGSTGTSCGSYSNCVKITSSAEYSMCSSLKIIFWILFVIGLLSLYGGVFIARNFYLSKAASGLLQWSMNSPQISSILIICGLNYSNRN